MTHYLRHFTPPVAPTVPLDCHLTAHHVPRNPNDPGAWSGEPKPDDIRGHLDAQTAEYRDEALLPFRGPGVEAWKNLCDEYANERDSLKSQLSAALAERDTAQAEVARMNEIDTHVDSVLDEIHDLVWTNKSRGKLDDLPGFIRGLKEAHDAARETIRKQEAERDSRAVVTYSQEQFIERCTEIRAESQETIRALTEERDFFDAERIKVVEELTAREAPGEEWKRACRAQRADDESKRCECDGGRGFALVPYEPPRSEEGRPDSMVSDPTPPIRWQCSGCHWGFPGPWLQTCPCCGRKDYWSGSVHPNAPRWIPGALPIPTGTKTPATTEPNNCTVCGESIPVGHAQYFEAGTGKGTHIHCMSKTRANATRLAPLTDRETAGCEFCRGPKRRCNEKCGECCYCQRPLSVAEKIAAIDDTETPDVQLPPGLFSAVARAINNEEETDVRREGFAAARPCTLCHGTGKRRVNHDRGEGQSVTYEDCSCGGAPPSIPPAAIAEIMRVAKWLDCDPDLYSIMCVAEEKLRLATEQVEALKELGEVARVAAILESGAAALGLSLVGTDVPVVKLDRLKDAWGEYEAKRKERGWT